MPPAATVRAAASASAKAAAAAAPPVDPDQDSGDVSDSGSVASTTSVATTAGAPRKSRASRLAKNPSPERKIAQQKCSFDNSIKKICNLKQYSGVGMRENSRRVVDRIAQILVSKIAENSNRLRLLRNMMTITPQMVACSFQSILPGKVGEAAAAAGKAAVEMYESEVNLAKGGSGPKTAAGKAAPVRREARAHLCVAVKIVENYLRQFNGTKWHLDSESAVFGAGALQYVLRRVIDAAAKARTQDRRNISKRDVFMGVETDEELASIFRTLNIQIVGAGVVPFLPSILEEHRRKVVRKAAPVTATEEEADISDDEGGDETDADDGDDDDDGSSTASAVGAEEGESKTAAAAKSGSGARRVPNGRRSLQKIRKYQRTTGLLITATCHGRLVRHLAETLHPKLRFQEEAMHAIQLVNEHMLTKVLRDAVLRRTSLGLQTVKSEDVRHAYNAQNYITSNIRTEAECVKALNKVLSDLMLPVAGPRKLGYRAAVKLISKEAKEEARLALISLVCEFVPTIVKVTELRGMKTVSVKDVREAFASRGIFLAH